MKKKFKIRNSGITLSLVIFHQTFSLQPIKKNVPSSFTFHPIIFFSIPIHFVLLFIIFQIYSIPHYYCNITPSLFSFYLVPYMSHYCQKCCLSLVQSFMSSFCSWLYRNLPEGGVSAASHTSSAIVLGLSMKHCCYLD